MQAKDKPVRTLSGRVTKQKMPKTVTVAVERTVKHPLYKKYLRRFTRMLAHDEKGQCREGDLVEIEECRPISSRKSWRVRAILASASGE
jgi:small subunit ribosomal protein S17